MTGTSLNLSLLSRGVGEVYKNGHEKVDVYLEPEDYYNFSTNPNRFFLPPIRSSYSGPHDHSHHHKHSFFDTSLVSRGHHSQYFPSKTSRETNAAAAATAVQEFRVPKTFTTRKGALLLFSEDLAQRNIGPEGSRHLHHQKNGGASGLSSITPASSMDSQVYLKTVEDLANSILKYGDHDRPDNTVYLKFVHARRDNFERQIRPGYSAKRYLSTWTRTWDDTVFDSIIKHGYITERSLYQYNLVVPNMRRRLFHEDLSHMPQPYRLMRNMLMMPGSLSGYTFYRADTSDFAEESDGDQESIVLRKRPETNLRNIRVIKTKAGVQEEIAYSDLDRQSQKEVITDLLVKSAVHYALKKQEEIYEESVIRAVQSGQDGLITDGQGAAGVVHEFDMRDAVEVSYSILNNGCKAGERR
ncbi:reticulocyte-binding protein 2-like protein a [Plakobranchus ocellatus]|uniref:Reticulocyte-binding protein 2-like protein a n=1 Tax=Plakobranchus ocellatus TaxID=259542 RepID=A0AAV4CLJ0_9GAST|nr:reticulocyte-binding protein 2-like protein a [Plakobranchus ocellatus]